jgi:hypothetical protein
LKAFKQRARRCDAPQSGGKIALLLLLMMMMTSFFSKNLAVEEDEEKNAGISSIMTNKIHPQFFPPKTQNFITGFLLLFFDDYGRRRDYSDKKSKFYENSQ